MSLFSLEHAFVIIATFGIMTLFSLNPESGIRVIDYVLMYGAILANQNHARLRMNAKP